MSLSVRDFEWLAGADAEPFLSAATANVADSDPTILADRGPHAQQRRFKLTPQQKRQVEEQVLLRRRALKKFPDAAKMFFTPMGLQQCTDHEIGVHKASRFTDCKLVADYCCGIGGDLTAIGMKTKVLGFDLNPLHVAISNANCKVRHSNGTAEVADVTQLDPSNVSAWHIDPDRRSNQIRTVRLDYFQPSWRSVQSMIERNPDCALKLAPATPIDDRFAAAELEWIGHRRSCQQLVAWFGRFAHASGKRVATVLHDGKNYSFSGESGDHESTMRAENVGEFVYEPHAAVLAAGLGNALARSLDLHPLIPKGGYLTGDILVDAPFVSSFRVVHAAPFHEKKIRKVLRQHEVGIVEVKKRGVDVDPAKLQKLWRGNGDRALTVIITRRAKIVTAVIAERMNSG